LRNSHGKSQNSRPGEKPGINSSPDLFWRWEQAKLTFKIGVYEDTTIIDYAQRNKEMLRNWTKIWFGMPASELTRGDGGEVLRLCQEAGKPLVFVRRLKNTIHLGYVGRS
jgi:hypothetical protein